MRVQIRMRGVFAGAAALAIGVLSACDSPARSADGVDTVSGIPQCTTCEIVLEKVFTIVDSGGPTSIALHVPPVTDSRGRFYFSSNEGANGVVVFDSTGRFLSHIGRLGSGPGEFGPNFTTTIGKGDTILVCGAKKCQLFSPSFEYVRSIEMGSVGHFGSVVFRNGDFGFKGIASDSPREGQPVHRISTDGAVVRSFGAVTPFPRTCNYCIPHSGMGITRDSTKLWISPAGRYELQLWSEEGDLSRTIVMQDSPWFISWDPSGKPNEVMSLVNAVDHDRGEVLFIHGSAAVRSDTAIPLPPGMFLGTEEISPIVVTHVPQIDAVDPETGRVLASRSVPDLIVSRYGGKFPISTRDLGGAAMAVDVWRVRLKR